MTQARRPTLFAALFIGALILLVAAALYSIENRQINSACAATGDSCVAVATPVGFLSAVMVSAAGLLIAVGLAMALGMNWQRGAVPNTDLAKRIEEEESHLQDYRLRRAQLDEWTAMATARAVEKAAAEAAAAQSALDAEQAFIMEASRWIEEDDEKAEEDQTEEEQRSKVLAEHMMHLARVKPEAVAEVIKVWINQRQR